MSEFVQKCKGCKFAEESKRVTFLNGKNTPYCTNAFRRLDYNEKTNKEYCASYRKS